MIKKIIVPTDGSDHADKALDLAFDIAEKYAAEVIVLHVILRSQSVFDLLGLAKKLHADAAVTNRLQELCDASIEAVSTPYGGIVSLPAPDNIIEIVGELICADAKTRAEAKELTGIRTYTVEGSPIERILAAEEHENADMIVMGSRGLGKFDELFMGSVSHKVSHLSKSTCVTVK
tara:strand:- start:967 stop:1494 length:528 start_codon:yes stop_codon:yes gene_type:complete